MVTLMRAAGRQRKFGQRTERKQHIFRFHDFNSMKFIQVIPGPHEFTSFSPNRHLPMHSNGVNYDPARSRSALPMTDTDEKLMARAAMSGLNSHPNAGYRTPAAIGIPSAL